MQTSHRPTLHETSTSPDKEATFWRDSGIHRRPEYEHRASFTISRPHDVNHFNTAGGQRYSSYEDYRPHPNRPMHFDDTHYPHIQGFYPGTAPLGPSAFAPPGAQTWEHQQMKGRKRNNLPKRSTDVMKNWFDQVRNQPHCVRSRACEEKDEDQTANGCT